MLLINGGPNVGDDLTSVSTDISTVEGKVDIVDDYLDTEIAAITTKLAKPAQNAATDATIAEVIGTKADTTAGSSIVAQLKLIIANLLVPTQNTANNNTFVDVVGQKTDTVAGTSLYANQLKIKAKTDLVGAVTDMASNQTLLGYDNSFYQHIHNPAKVYPTLAAGKVITGDNAAWTLGVKAEVVPVNTITNAFDIHYINVENATATDVYELVLYKGAEGAEVEIGRVRTHKNSTQSGAINVPIQIAPQLANTRISAAVASASGGGDALTISVFYHEYV